MYHRRKSIYGFLERLNDAIITMGNSTDPALGGARLNARFKGFAVVLCLLGSAVPSPKAQAEPSDIHQQTFMDHLQKSLDPIVQSEVTDVAEDGVHRTLPLPPVSPDVFGTVAVPVSKTRMDDRWVRVSRPVEDSSLRELATSAAGLPRRQQASFVQAIVNRMIRYSSDQENWGQADYWATIEETLHRGAGDCEDIAVMKMHALRQLGFDDKDLYLVVGSDDAGRSHALLIVNLENDFIVLDDRAGRVLKADEVDGFRPILSFGSGMSWVHGTRIGAASPSQ